ncbi:MAG: ATPase [Porphyromonadaceae bacterium]|nr:ATPase [Porphyromonadaceae bacterium]
MILIADSGSTKTEWWLVGKEGVVRTFRTQGIHPYLLSDEEIRRLLSRELLMELPVERITEVYFYGAGCTGARKESLRLQLQRVIAPDRVEVESDLLGAARALYGDTAGIVGILGTGSNAGMYDGVQVVTQTPSLGFILGDEGSGVDLGKRLLADALKGALPAQLSEAFFSRYSLTREVVLENVYRRPLPNRYVAQFSPFVREHLDNPYMRQLALDCFTSFFRRNICAYSYRDYPVRLVGSVAYHYEALVREAAASLSVTIDRVLPSPGEALAQYHSERRKE